jgi:hypothetical protein
MIKPFVEKMGGMGEMGRMGGSGGKSLPAPDPTLPQFKVAEKDKEQA